MSHPSAESAASTEWVLAAMALRAIFGRVDPAEVVELRISVTREALPGLAVIEYEFVDRDGMCVAGGGL